MFSCQRDHELFFFMDYPICLYLRNDKFQRISEIFFATDDQSAVLLFIKATRHFNPLTFRPYLDNSSQTFQPQGLRAYDVSSERKLKANDKLKMSTN